MISRGDHVTMHDYDGTWRLEHRFTLPGWWWLKPIDEVAKAIALWLPHGMLVMKATKLTELTKDHDGIY